MLAAFYLVAVAALLQGGTLAFRFAPGQSHSAARAMFHRVVRGENVDEDELGAAPAQAANAATEDDADEDDSESGDDEDSTDVDRPRQRDDEARLLRDVFSNYDDYVFPGKNLQVSFGLSYQCANYDRATHVLTSRVFERIIWRDDRLVWNASDYGGIDTIRVRPWRLWLPDLQLYNEADYEGCKDWVNAIVLSSGTIIWFPPTTLRSFCKPTGKSSAQCQLTIGSWVYHNEFLTLTSSKHSDVEQFDLTNYIEDCPYTISKVESKIGETTASVYTYSTLEVQFNINASN